MTCPLPLAGMMCFAIHRACSEPSTGAEAPKLWSSRNYTAWRLAWPTREHRTPQGFRTDGRGIKCNLIGYWGRTTPLTVSTPVFNVCSKLCENFCRDSYLSGRFLNPQSMTAHRFSFSQTTTTNISYPDLLQPPTTHYHTSGRLYPPRLSRHRPR